MSSRAGAKAEQERAHARDRAGAQQERGRSRARAGQEYYIFISCQYQPPCNISRAGAGQEQGLKEEQGWSRMRAGQEKEQGRTRSPIRALIQNFIQIGR